MEQQHEMILEITHPSGEDEWYCPTCGRRVVMIYEPEFRKTILEVGDEYAAHSGGKGGMKMGTLQATSIKSVDSEEYSDSASEEPNFRPWLTWLNEVDFDKLWKDED
jgi:hypothetical protein